MNITRRMMAGAIALLIAFTLATSAQDIPSSQPNRIVPRMMSIIARWETCQLKSYKDNDGTWHVGYGTGNANKNLAFVIDENTVLKNCDEAMGLLVTDLSQIYMPQLDKLLAKVGFVPNDYQYSGLLDTGYNRGMGRLRDSLAMRFLAHPEIEYYDKWAAMALIYSRVESFESKSEQAKAALDKVSKEGDQFIPLDVAKDKKTGIERVHLGLTLRRIDDASLFLTKEN